MKRLAGIAVLLILLWACGESSLQPEVFAELPASTTATTAVTSVADDTAHDQAGHDEDGHPEDTSEDAAHDEAMAHDEDMADDDMADDDMADDDMAPEDEQAETVAADPDADRVIEVTMSEFAFEPGAITVTAGETVQFIVANVGAIEHELRLSNAHRIEEHLASGHADHDDEGGHHGDADVVLVVAAGETDTITVPFSEDETLFTEVACLLPGHYEAGMVASLSYDA